MRNKRLIYSGYHFLTKQYTVDRNKFRYSGLWYFAFKNTTTKCFFNTLTLQCRGSVIQLDFPFVTARSNMAPEVTTQEFYVTAPRVLKKHKLQQNTHVMS